MKIVGTLLLGLTLAGCSVTKTSHTKAHDMNLVQKAHFVSLVSVYRENRHKPPTKQLGQEVAALADGANMKRQCEARKCWLKYNDYLIRFEEEWVEIKLRNGSFVKFDINEPEEAAKFIYG